MNAQQDRQIPEEREISQVHLGDQLDFESDAENFFDVSFLPIDIFDHWDRCGQIADFVGYYFQHSFRAPGSHNIISTVVNELVENAVKYSRNKSSPIEIEIRKRGEHLLMRVANLIPRNQRDHFIAICRDLFERDLDELYLEKLVHGRAEHNFSGIGLILLKKDYDVQIGIDIAPTNDGIVRVSATVDLEVAC